MCGEFSKGKWIEISILVGSDDEPFGVCQVDWLVTSIITEITFLSPGRVFFSSLRGGMPSELDHPEKMVLPGKVTGILVTVVWLESAMKIGDGVKASKEPYR